MDALTLIALVTWTLSLTKACLPIFAIHFTVYNVLCLHMIKICKNFFTIGSVRY